MLTFSLNNKNTEDETGTTLNELFEKDKDEEIVDDAVYTPVDEILTAMENPNRRAVLNPVHTHCETVEDLIRLITSSRTEYETAVIS